MAATGKCGSTAPHSARSCSQVNLHALQLDCLMEQQKRQTSSSCRHAHSLEPQPGSSFMKPSLFLLLIVVANDCSSLEEESKGQLSAAKTGGHHQCSQLEFGLVEDLVCWASLHFEAGLHLVGFVHHELPLPPFLTAAPASFCFIPTASLMLSCCIDWASWPHTSEQDLVSGTCPSLEQRCAVVLVMSHC